MSKFIAHCIWSVVFGNAACVYVGYFIVSSVLLHCRTEDADRSATYALCLYVFALSQVCCISIVDRLTEL